MMNDDEWRWWGWRLRMVTGEWWMVNGEWASAIVSEWVSAHMWGVSAQLSEKRKQGLVVPLLVPLLVLFLAFTWLLVPLPLFKRRQLRWQVPISWAFCWWLPSDDRSTQASLYHLRPPFLFGCPHRRSLNVPCGSLLSTKLANFRRKCRKVPDFCWCVFDAKSLILLAIQIQS